MLIRFESNVAGQFIMMGDVALPLLRMMGMSGNMQGAVSGEDLTSAMHTLEVALQVAPAPNARAGEDEEVEPPIALQRRALPLLEMLRRAAAGDGYVMWQPD
jgi:hypothetical protein